MKFDMHCHTKEGSMDGKVMIEEYIRTLKRKGFGGMLVSDHDSYDGYREWKNAIKGRAPQDFVVLKGVEYDTCDCGHILVIMPFGVKLKILELRGLPGSILVKIVHAYGGILGPAHPYGEKFMSMISTNERKKKYQQRIAQLLPQFDFVEIFNACESAETNAKAKRLAEKFNKPGFGGSDAHRLDCIGKAYTELPDTIRSEDDLIAYVKTCPQIECGGEHYNGTTKDRIGRLNMVLVDSFYFYNKLANGWRWRKRRRELFDIIEKKFAKDFEGCTLTELRYDEDVENRFAEEIEKYHKENNQELIVVLSTFDTDEKGGDGEVNPNATYTNWQWHLVKTKDKKNWEIISWGY